LSKVVQTLPPLDLAYKHDAAKAQQRMRAYWAGEMIDRPCISIRAPRSGMIQPNLSPVASSDHKFERAIADFEEWASCTFFGGESMPNLHPWYGPDQWAGFLGAKMTMMPELGTSWVEPFVDDWDTVGALAIDPDNRWWKGVLDLAALAAEMGEGKFLVSTIDTHSNMDCLSAIRDPSRLCMDLIENPDGVRRAVKQVDELYEPVYEAVWRVGRMATRGSTSWSDMYSEGRTQTVQCDFSYMVSPEHFREFMLPSLEHEISCLDHAVYHLDGVGELAHVDDLLAIPNLHTIQWVPGDGQPQAPAWVELLQKIQKAGRSVQVIVTPDELQAVYSELAPEKTFYWVMGVGAEEDARELILWMENHV
jgi:hypothetical protein